MKSNIFSGGLKVTRGFLLLFVLLGIFIFASSALVRAMPDSVLDQLKANAGSTRISPNPEGFRLYWGNGFNQNTGGTIFATSNGRSTGNGFKHLLKNEDSSNVRYLTLKAYYDTLGEAQTASFDLRSAGTCNFTATPGAGNSASTEGPGPEYGSYGSNNTRHRVMLFINGENKFDEPATAGNMATACGRFDNTTYAVNPGLVTEGNKDPGTNKYVITLNFFLSGNRYTSGAEQVRFQVRASGTGLLGMEKNTDKTRFGIAEAFGNDNPGNSAAAGIGFGPSCVDGDLANARITVYDPDTQGFGHSYMFVMKREEGNGAAAWTRLTLGEYVPIQNVAWEADPGRFRVIGPESGTESEVRLVNMQKFWDYLLVYDTPNQKGQNVNIGPGAFSKIIPNTPTGNVLSFRLPGDTIATSVNCRFTLNPSVTQNSPVAGPFTYDQTFNVRGNIDVEGVDSANHEWQLSVIRSPSRPGNQAGGDSLSRPCVYQPVGCSPIDGGSQTFANDFATPGNVPDPPNSYNYGVTNAAVGEWVCFMMSVKNPTWEAADDDTWRHSPLVCNWSGAKPKVQSWGYDVRTTGRVKTSLTDVAGRRYGSWSEYGLLSNGRNINMASGAGLVGGQVAGTTQPSWSNLTFANDPVTAVNYGYGNFGGLTLPSVSLNGATQRTNLTVNNYAELTAILGSDKGTIRVNGTLRITGSLQYPNSTTGITGIPLIKLVADNIVIDNAATRIDPWLVALTSTAGTGNISTCFEATGGAYLGFQSVQLRGNMGCGSPLKFNAPVIADRIFLYRTYDQRDGATAAETFNLRADNFLSSYVGGGTELPVATTDSVTELPPRF